MCFGKLLAHPCVIDKESCEILHCVPRAPVCEVLSRLYHSICSPIVLTHIHRNTMHFTWFRQLNLNAALRQWRNLVKFIVSYVLNPKHATTSRTLGLLGHNVLYRSNLALRNILAIYVQCDPYFWDMNSSESYAISVTCTHTVVVTTMYQGEHLETRYVTRYWYLRGVDVSYLVKPQSHILTLWYWQQCTKVDTRKPAMLPGTGTWEELMYPIWLSLSHT